MIESGTFISAKDTDILRGLAGRIAEISLDPVNQERRAAWYNVDSGPDSRTMILAEHGGIRDENSPVTASSLICEGGWARAHEGHFRTMIYLFETLKDDHVVEPRVTVNWQIEQSNYGVEVVTHLADNNGHLGARRWDPPIVNIDRDFDKLKQRRFSVDRDATFANKERLEDVFGGILSVEIRGSFYWSMGLTVQAINLIGMENLMMFMFDDPEGLHRLMGFLRDDHIAQCKWLEDEGLYSPNDENDYIGSGSMGYSHDMTSGGTGRSPVTRDNLWILSESQETVGVGPDQFEEFVFPYQLDVAKSFAKTYYGCCEPVHSRWHVIKRFPNLARVSISPWADEEFMADALSKEYVYSRKPNPTLISTGAFDEDAIRDDIRNTLKVAGDCRLEIIMKDVHTLNNQPERLARWVEIAREETEQ